MTTINDTIEEDTPTAGDYVMSSCGALGTFAGRTGVYVVGGEDLGAYVDEFTALSAIVARMEQEKFWPKVWRCSDRCEYSLVSMEY